MVTAARASDRGFAAASHRQRDRHGDPDGDQDVADAEDVAPPAPTAGMAKMSVSGPERRIRDDDAVGAPRRPRSRPSRARRGRRASGRRWRGSRRGCRPHREPRAGSPGWRGCGARPRGRRGSRRRRSPARHRRPATPSGSEKIRELEDEAGDGEPRPVEPQIRETADPAAEQSPTTTPTGIATQDEHRTMVSVGGAG